MTAPLRAYLDALSVTAGGTLTGHGCGLTAAARVVELLHGDPHPDGPGVIEHEVGPDLGVVSAPDVPTQTGSYAVADDALPVGSDLTVSLWIWPTDLSRASTVARWETAGGGCALVLADGRLGLSRDGSTQWLDYRLRERMWAFVGVAVGGSRALRAEGVSLFAALWGRTGGPFIADVDAPLVHPTEPRLSLGFDGVRGDFDGRVCGVRIHHRALDIVELMNVMNGVGEQADVEWDLADRSDPDVAPPMSSLGGALRLLHAPTRSTAVPPPAESGGRPLTAPESVHLHRDDLEDCEWPVLFEWTVPPTTRPGIYSVRLQADEARTDLPFVVARPEPVTLLVPTLTWQAYANLGRDPEVWPGRSHYSLHSDGSPVSMTTSRKPSQTFGPHARLEVDGGDGFAGGDNATHLLMADLYAWYWLRETVAEPGVIEDRQLHEGGADLLADVQVLVLSAHPEYWTARMLDALTAHLDRGGSVVYLGGNGLYWVTSLHPTKPHVMEVRRWGGSQTWSIDADDRRHQLEPCTGGLWAEAGRPPNASVGVGFAGFGNGASMEFTRTPVSYEPAWSWLFEGIDGETLGAHGLNGGAGNEFDAYDAASPGPGDSVVLAQARPTTIDHFGTFERAGRRSPDDSVVADIVATRTPAGGLVLAISSITASGCLTSRSSPELGRLVGNAIRAASAKG